LWSSIAPIKDQVRTARPPSNATNLRVLNYTKTIIFIACDEILSPENGNSEILNYTFYTLPFSNGTSFNIGSSRVPLLKVNLALIGGSDLIGGDEYKILV
jgi:hypothetical protein